MLRHFAKTAYKFSTKNLYTVLGVKEDSDFTEIKKSYISKIKTSHPDIEDGSHHKFIELKKAFEVLSDPGRRKIYDQSIGILAPGWQLEGFSTSRNFENEQIQRILMGKTSRKVRLKTALEILDLKYMEQTHKKQSQKYFIMTMVMSLSIFSVFWTTWEFGEKLLTNYKGKTTYEEKTSKSGKDLSIMVTQIR